MKLSLVIPARNEAGSIQGTVEQFAGRLEAERIEHEILVVDDGSTDETLEIVDELSRRFPQVRSIVNRGRHGFGRAVRRGLEVFTGDAVAIVMADASDSPDDLVVYYRKLEQGYDCAFGSRFIKGGAVVDYPAHKLLINRLANHFVRLLFGIRLNDTTNAFKCYRRHVIEGLQPLISEHFNLTVEMPLKAIIRGYTYAVTPITWRNRKTGVSKLKIQEMGSRYLFITLYAWLEKTLSRRDYHRATVETSDAEPAAAEAIQRPGHA
ncbi:MAG: glycosyltransferase family 2 protein [Bryobacterales bacterium]|nr:glycosyltransferase family 2 protein [Bryobacterales bacterium]